MSDLVRSRENRPSLRFFDDEFGNLFEGFFRPARMLSTGDDGDLVPAIDVVEDEKQYTVTAELPGVEQKDIDVSIENGVLSISAERKAETEDKDDKGRLIRRESRYGRYARSMRLDAAINVEGVTASHQNGILKLVLPKMEEAKPKKIDISVK